MAAQTNKIGSLEDEALRRKERLKSLKRKTADNEDTATSNNEQTHLPLPKYVYYLLI